MKLICLVTKCIECSSILQVGFPENSNSIRTLHVADTCLLFNFFFLAGSRYVIAENSFFLDNFFLSSAEQSNEIKFWKSLLTIFAGPDVVKWGSMTCCVIKKN